MPKIIVASRYLKNGKNNKTGKVKNLIKYIATREGSKEYTPQENSEPISKKQEHSLRKLLELFPESKNLFEYDDYIKNPSQKNGNELISEILERYADKITDTATLVSYMAERPGVKKIGTHGLFTGNGGIVDLDEAMREVGEHDGNIWSHVVSLKREDAERLQYVTPEKWRGLVLRHLETIAGATNIKLDDMKFYAAFHDTAHHPHIHLLVFSTDPKQKGYLQPEGIERIKSAFVNDIFHDELSHVYQKQTTTRNLIKEQCLEEMNRLFKSIGNDVYEYEKISNLIMKLNIQLKTVTGKKVYGYLPKSIKSTVDEILSELAKNPTIARMYEHWCEYEQEKYRTYSNKDKEIAPLEQQDAFKSIKNMIIKAALNADMHNRPHSVLVGAPTDTDDFEINPDDILFMEDFQTEDNRVNGNGEHKKGSPKIRVSHNKPVRDYASSSANAAFSLLKALGRLINTDYAHKWSGSKPDIDHKLKRAIDRKKEAMGIQIDRTMEQEY